MTLPHFAITNLQSADFRLAQATPPGQPVPPPRLTDTFDVLWALAEAASALRDGGWTVAAKALKDDAACVIERWLDGDASRDEARRDLELLLDGAQQTIRDMDCERSEQLTTARAHAAATAERWAAEDWDAGPDTPDAELTMPQFVALAVSGPNDEPAPGPHGDEEQTNYGGWRSRVTWGS